MSIHPSHRMTTERHPNHHDDYCSYCDIREGNVGLEAPCAHNPADAAKTRTFVLGSPVHPSHVLERIYGDDIETTRCKVCNETGKGLHTECDKDDAPLPPPLEKMDFSKIEERVLANMFKNIHPSHVRRIGMGSDVWACERCNCIAGCTDEDDNILAKPCKAEQRYVDGMGRFGGKLTEEMAAEMKSGAALVQEIATQRFKEEKFPTRPASDPAWIKGASDKLNDAVKNAVDAFNKLTPAEQEEHLKKQRESWVRGEMGFGDEGTRVVLVQSAQDFGKKTEENLRRIMLDVARRMEDLLNAADMKGFQHREAANLLKKLRDNAQ